MTLVNMNRQWLQASFPKGSLTLASSNIASRP